MDAEVIKTPDCQHPMRALLITDNSVFPIINYDSMNADGKLRERGSGEGGILREHRKVLAH